MQAVTLNIVSMEVLERLFGLGIAYAFPGGIILVGLSFHFAGLQSWLGLVAEKDTTFVGFLFVMAASIGLGMLAGVVRAFALEGPMTTKCKPMSHNHVARLQKEQVYQNLISQHYYYYQAYGNTAVAIVVGSVLYLTGALPSVWQWLAVLVSGGVMVSLLIWAACEAVRRFEEKRASLLAGQPTPSAN